MEKIRGWAAQPNLIEGSNPAARGLTMVEELGETLVDLLETQSTLNMRRLKMSAPTVWLPRAAC
jgi:hypothetical protein